MSFDIMEFVVTYKWWLFPIAAFVIAIIVVKILG